MPDEILHCPEGTTAADGAAVKVSKKNGRMRLDDAGFLPEPSYPGSTPGNKNALRHAFAHCVATRRTNLAARDYRQWFCAKQGG